MGQAMIRIGQITICIRQGVESVVESVGSYKATEKGDYG